MFSKKAEHTNLHLPKAEPWAGLVLSLFLGGASAEAQTAPNEPKPTAENVEPVHGLNKERAVAVLVRNFLRVPDNLEINISLPQNTDKLLPIYIQSIVMQSLGEFPAELPKFDISGTFGIPNTSAQIPFTVHLPDQNILCLGGWSIYNNDVSSYLQSISSISDLAQRSGGLRGESVVFSGTRSAQLNFAIEIPAHGRYIFHGSTIPQNKHFQLAGHIDNNIDQKVTAISAVLNELNIIAGNELHVFAAQDDFSYSPVGVNIQIKTHESDISIACSRSFNQKQFFAANFLYSPQQFSAVINKIVELVSYRYNDQSALYVGRLPGARPNDDHSIFVVTQPRDSFERQMSYNFHLYEIAFKANLAPEAQEVPIRGVTSELNGDGLTYQKVTLTLGDKRVLAINVEDSVDLLQTPTYSASLSGKPLLSFQKL